MGITYIDRGVTVTHEELSTSPEENHSDTEGFGATRRLKCAWGDRFELADQLMGGAFIASGGSFEDLAILVGAKYPGRPAAIVTGVQVKPFFPAEVAADAANSQTVSGCDVAQYEHAELLVQYDTSDNNGGDLSNDSQVANERLESNLEFLTGPPFNVCEQGVGSPGDPATWANKDSKVTMVKRIVGFDWIFTRKNLPGLPATYLNLLGTVNSVAIVSRALNFTMEIETLLYTSINLTRARSGEGIAFYTAEMRFSWRGGDPVKGPANWNKIWDFLQSKWIRLQDCKTGVQIDFYEKTDLTPLVTTIIN